MKRTVGLVLLMVIIGAAMCTCAEEAETFTNGGYTYTLTDDGSATITGYIGKDKELAIPSELDGHTVKGIGDKAFSKCSGLTIITLPDGVTGIGDEAFDGCGRLTIIVTEGSYAEQYCADNGLTFQYTDYLDWLDD